MLKRQNKIAVLNLHRVSNVESPYWPPLRPEIFEELLLFLQENFEVCLFDQLPDIRTTKPVAVLSFDDGYYDFIEHALPLLEKYGMPANMNIIPQCAETGKPIWNVRLYDFLSSAAKSLIGEIKLPGFEAKLAGDSPQDKLRFGLKISRYMKSRPRLKREEIWQSIEQVMAKVDYPQTRMITTAEISQIGWQTHIGAHSFSHESMGIEDNEFFERDFEQCRKYFAESLELPLSTYAFPNGSYRPEQIEFLRKEGIRQILLVDDKFAERRTDVFTRLTIYGETKKEVKMKALGF